MVHDPTYNSNPSQQSVVMNSTSLEDVALSEHSDHRAQSINSLHTDDLRSSTPTSTRTTTPTPENNPSFEELQERLDRSERQIANIQNQRDHLLRLTDGFKQQLSMLERERCDAASEKERRSKESDDHSFDMKEVAALEERMNQLNELIGAQKKLELGLDAGLHLGSNAKNASDSTFATEMAEEWRTVRHLLDDIFIARSNCKGQFDAILANPRCSDDAQDQAELIKSRDIVVEAVEATKPRHNLEMPSLQNNINRKLDMNRDFEVPDKKELTAQQSNPYKEALVRQLKALTGEVSEQNVTVEDALHRICALQADISQRQEQTAAAIQMGTDALLRHTLTSSPRPRSVRDSNESSVSPERNTTNKVVLAKPRNASNNVSSEKTVKSKTMMESQPQHNVPISDSSANASKKFVYGYGEDVDNFNNKHKSSENRIVQTDVSRGAGVLRLTNAGIANNEIPDYLTSYSEGQPVSQHFMQLPFYKKAFPATITQNGNNNFQRNSAAITAESTYRLNSNAGPEIATDPRLLKAQQRIICNISRFNEIMNIQRHEVDNLNDTIRTLNEVLRQNNLPNLILPQVRSDCVTRRTSSQFANTVDCVLSSCNVNEINGLQRAQSEQPVHYLQTAPMTYMMPIDNLPGQAHMLHAQQQRFNNNNSDVIYNSMQNSTDRTDIGSNNQIYNALSHNALLLKHLPQQQAQQSSAIGNTSAVPHTTFHYNNEAWESQAPLNVGAPPVFMHHHNNLIHQHNPNMRSQNQQMHLQCQQIHPLV